MVEMAVGRRITGECIIFRYEFAYKRSCCTSANVHGGSVVGGWKKRTREWSVDVANNSGIGDGKDSFDALLHKCVRRFVCILYYDDGETKSTHSIRVIQPRGDARKVYRCVTDWVLTLLSVFVCVCSLLHTYSRLHHFTRWSNWAMRVIDLRT